ncbi:antibiotic biosynthesis monooxygenase [Jannaschia pagri]|uniref:Antibiotic biosynthesis monooxygenase n=1 Tax=Jannaschia pagri TaxID=2829797 RepID=A0ABQ4NGE6_9RHOB|nr:MULTISPECIES: putative quinol monooxygenase [unclassified Jannaschia]GIT90393.1 antibiotic biosynthesis monooxygenase [Jannaschia sp. AI_61]GIT93502.1 antibiotic biosynthesis monooxygenase [Jannaschia sp. AI_62]
MFAVVVTITVHPGQMPVFMAAMLENAAASRAEPACQRFDVATDPARTDEVFLYEIYDDAAGFDAHREMPHYKVFDAAVAPLVQSKDVRTYSVVDA